MPDTNPFKIYNERIADLEKENRQFRNELANIKQQINLFNGMTEARADVVGEADRSGSAGVRVISAHITPSDPTEENDGILYAPPSWRGDYYGKQTDKTATVVFTEEESELIIPFKGYLANICFPKEDDDDKHYLMLHNNARVSNGAEHFGFLDDVVLVIPDSTSKQSSCGIPENVKIIKFKDSGIEYDQSGEMTFAFKDDKAYPVAVIA